MQLREKATHGVLFVGFAVVVVVTVVVVLVSVLLMVQVEVVVGVYTSALGKSRINSSAGISFNINNS